MSKVSETLEAKVRDDLMNLLVNLETQGDINVRHPSNVIPVLAQYVITGNPALEVAKRGAREYVAWLGMLEGRRRELAFSDLPHDYKASRGSQLQRLEYPGPNDYLRDIAEGHEFFNYTGRLCLLHKEPHPNQPKQEGEIT